MISLRRVARNLQEGACFEESGGNAPSIFNGKSIGGGLLKRYLGRRDW